MAHILPVNAAASVGTFAALHNSNFRNYFMGQLVSTSGTWMQAIAQGYLVFQLTKSEWALGVVACAAGAPMLFIAPFAGVIVERVPRRKLLLVTQCIQMLLAFVLFALVVTNTVQIWQIMSLALILGTVNAFDAPARQAFISDLVGKENLASGIALNSIIVNGSRVFGPTLAGLLLVTVGAAWCFLLNGLSFLFVLLSLMLIHLPARVKLTERPAALAQLREGLGYVRRHSVILPLLLLSANGGFFCWATLSLLPAFADKVLGSPEEGYAIMSATNGLGAVIAGLLVSVMGRRFGRGRFIMGVGLLIGVFIALLSRATTIPAAALMSLGVGFCVVAFFVTINTTIQLLIPNEFRGRVVSLYTLTIIGLNPFGSLLLGIIAQTVGSPNALLLYALLTGCLTAVVFLLYPTVRQLR